MPKRQSLDPQEQAGLFKRTEAENRPEPEQEDPVKPIGIGLHESEWERLEEIAGELGITRHGLALWALRDFIRRYSAGEIELVTETKKTLPGL